MSEARPADALSRHWTARLPGPLQPLAQLSRWDRPVGWQLLFLPCLMGLALGATEQGFWLRDGWLALMFLAGSIAMRGAGCTWNDILDRDIDAKVARTRGRPIPSGRISVRGALAWLAAQCGAGLGVLLALPPPAQIAALAALPLVAGYPLMKRITWWPQAWLGLCFSWGAPVAWLCVRPALGVEALLLFLGCVAWVIAYDTIYALQDREDDALVGVRSTALRFGDRWRIWTTGFYVAAQVFWAAAAAVTGAGIGAPAALGVIGALMIWPLLKSADPARPETALAAFKANSLVGLAVSAAFAIEPAWRTLLPYLP